MTVPTTPGNNQITNGSTSAGGTGAAAFSAPTNIIVPRPLRPDDGKWAAIGSIVGSIVGSFASKAYSKKVDEAMDMWDKINNKLMSKGFELIDRSPEEKAKQENEADNIYALLGWGDGVRNEQLQRARNLDGCLDMTYEELCQYVKCGYKPDYAGIYKRTVATVQQQISKQREELCKNVNRYAVRQCCAIETSLAKSAVESAVSAISQNREQERRKQYEINEQLYMKAAELMERARDGRLRQALDVNKDALDIRFRLYQTRGAAYLDYIRLGGELLAGSGSNLSSKAQSAAEMATKVGSDVSGLVATIIAMAIPFVTGSNDNGC